MSSMNLLRQLLDSLNMVKRVEETQAQERAQQQAQQPMAPGMLTPGNIDLAHRPLVYNRDGSYSTVRSMGAKVNGRETLVPTISDDGRQMTPQEAVAMAARTGRNLGTFKDAASSSAYGQNLHEDQAGQYEQMFQRGDPTTGPPSPQRSAQLGPMNVAPEWSLSAPWHPQRTPEYEEMERRIKGANGGTSSPQEPAFSGNITPGQVQVQRPAGEFDMNGGRNVGRLTVGEPFIHAPPNAVAGDVVMDEQPAPKHKVKLTIGPVQIEQNAPIDPKVMKLLLAHSKKSR